MALASSPTFSLTPSPQPQTLSTNYITSFDFSDTELPATYSEQFEIYGDRTIAKFLKMASAEFPCASDLIKWAEEGRLHPVSTGVARTISTDIFEFGSATPNTHSLRARQMVMVHDPATGVLEKGIVESITDTNTVVIKSYENAALGWTVGTSGLTVLIFGSEFRKGTTGMTGALEAPKTIKENNPIIIKDKYEISGTDMTQIGWVEVSTENGGSGYLWYLKSEHETRLRYNDYLEMSMVEGIPAESGSGAAGVGSANGGAAQGTKGFFYEVEENGNVFNGIMTAKSDFDSIIKRLDKQGSIAENTMHLNRTQSLAIDDYLAQQNSYGAGGTSYGLFNNSEQMALNLGFTGFHRGGYEFYKQSWRYLNDPASRGAIEGTAAVNGVMVPAGTKTVEDKVLGKKIRLPFLHVKYRKTAVEDRRYKTWLTGSAGGASNSDLDAMEVHFLSERALITIGANNFVILKG